jgi:hypothetical protein
MDSVDASFAVAIVSLLAVATYCIWQLRQWAPVRVASSEKVGFDYVLNVEFRNGKTQTYRGGCTVWHAVPSGDRAGSSVERWLCDRWTAIKWTEQEGGK